MESTSTVEVELGATEMYGFLYSIEKSGNNHEYSTHARMHEQNLTGDDSRVNVTIRAGEDDYDDISAETIDECELLLAAMIDQELDLLAKKQKHSDDSGLLPEKLT